MHFMKEVFILKKRMLCILLAVVLVFALAACKTEEKETIKSSKNISVQIIWEENKEDIQITTEAETLREALEEKSLISGEEGPYGLFVKTVKGISADESKEQWWCFTKGDEALMTSVDLIMISDGDFFKITLKEGY